MADDRVDGEDESGDDRDTVAPDNDVLTRDDLDTSSRGVLPIALLVIVGIIGGFILGRATAPDEEAATDDSAATAEGAEEGGALPCPTGDVNRTGYWGFANLEPTVIDTFDRADDPTSLGEAGTGQAWEPVAGAWGTEGDRAVTGGGARDTPNLAVVPEGEGDGLTEVTMMVVEEGAGLVFRYLDPENHWSVTANPGVGSWSLNRIIEGDTELVSEIVAPTSDGMTVSVTQDGSTVRVLFDCEEYFTVTDAALGQQLQGGLIAAANTNGEARWDRFLVMRFRDAPADGAATTTSAPAG